GSQRLGPSSCAQGLEHVLRLRHGAVVRGRVLDDGGRPLSGLAVRVSVGEWVWSMPVQTNAEGWFEIDGVPAGLQRVQLDGGGDLALVRCDPACAAARVEVLADEVHELSLRAVKGGRICAAARPGARACVRVFPAQAEELVSAAEGEIGQSS